MDKRIPTGVKFTIFSDELFENLDDNFLIKVELVPLQAFAHADLH